MVWRWTLIKALRPYRQAELTFFKCARDQEQDQLGLVRRAPTFAR